MSDEKKPIGTQGSAMFQVTPGDLTLAREFEFEKLVKDPQLKAILRSMFVEAVTEGVKNNCRFPLSSHEVQQARYLFDGLRDLGGGDTHKGLTVAFENLRSVSYMRQAFGRTSESVGKWVIIGILGLAAAAMGLGAVVSINKG